MQVGAPYQHMPAFKHGTRSSMGKTVGQQAPKHSMGYYSAMTTEQTLVSTAAGTLQQKELEAAATAADG